MFLFSGYGADQGCAQRQYDSLRITDGIHRETPTWSSQGLRKVNNSPATPQAAMTGMTLNLVAKQGQQGAEAYQGGNAVKTARKTLWPEDVIGKKHCQIQDHADHGGRDAG